MLGYCLHNVWSCSSLLRMKTLSCQTYSMPDWSHNSNVYKRMRTINTWCIQYKHYEPILCRWVLNVHVALNPVGLRNELKPTVTMVHTKGDQNLDCRVWMNYRLKYEEGSCFLCWNFSLAIWKERTFSCLWTCELLLRRFELLMLLRWPVSSELKLLLAIILLYLLAFLFISHGTVSWVCSIVCVYSLCNQTGEGRKNFCQRIKENFKSLIQIFLYRVDKFL